MLMRARRRLWLVERKFRVERIARCLICIIAFLCLLTTAVTVYCFNIQSPWLLLFFGLLNLVVLFISYVAWYIVAPPTRRPPLPPPQTVTLRNQRPYDFSRFPPPANTNLPPLLNTSTGGAAFPFESGPSVFIPRARISASYVGPFTYDEVSGALTTLAPPPPPTYDQSSETQRAIQQTNAPPPYSENGVLRRVSTTSPPPVYISSAVIMTSPPPRLQPTAPPEELIIERLPSADTTSLPESPRIRTLHVVIDCSKAEPSLFQINEESVI